jgi:hypothetical protein
VPSVLVALRDRFGNLFADDASTAVAAALAPPAPAGLALSGTTPRAVAAGIASFDDLVLSAAATGARLSPRRPASLTRRRNCSTSNLRPPSSGSRARRPTASTVPRAVEFRLVFSEAVEVKGVPMPPSTTAAPPLPAGRARPSSTT